MKNTIYYSFGLIVFLIGLAACEKDKEALSLSDENQFTSPVFKTTSNDDNTVLLEEKADEVYQSFTWEKADFSLSTEVDYAIEMSDTDAFTKKITVGSKTRETKADFTVKAFNDAVISLLTTINGDDYVFSVTQHTFYLRVSATLKESTTSNTTFKPLYSKAITVTVTPYKTVPPPVNHCTKFNKIGIIGNGANGWNDGDDVFLSSKSQKEPCVLVGKATLRTGDIKIRANGKWDVPNGDWGNFAFPQGKAEVKGRNVTITDQTAGVYDVTFDLNTLEVTFLKEGQKVDESIKEPTEWTKPVFVNTDNLDTNDFNGQDLDAAYDTFSWSPVSSGSTQTPASYTLQMSLDKTFADAIESFDKMNDTKLSVTKKDINERLTKLGAKKGIPKIVYFRIEVAVGTKSAYSNSIKRVIAITSAFPDKLYITGAGTGGWDKPGENPAKTIPQSTTAGIYELAKLPLTADVMKFFTTEGWDNTLNVDGFTLPTGLTAPEGGGENLPFAGDAGNYKITIDLTTDPKTITFEKEDVLVDPSIKAPAEWILPILTNSTTTAQDFTTDISGLYGRFSWGAVDAGNTDTTANYVLELSNKEDFDDKNSAFPTTAKTYLDISKKTLNQKLLDLSATAGTSFTFYARLKITVGDKERYNVPITMMVTPQMKCLAFESVGAIGDAQSGGWDTDTDLTQDATNKVIYKGTIVLTSGSLKIRANNAWDDNWGYSNLTDKNAFGDAGGNIQINTAGSYDIEINVCTGALTITKK